MVRGAVVFDLFGTLTVDQTRTERHSRQAAAADTLGAPLPEFVLALRESFTARAAGLWGTPAESLLAICHGLGIAPSPAAVDAAVRQREDAERLLARPRPGTLDVLTALHVAGVRTGVLSDCTGELVTVWPELPYAALVTASVFSCDVGVRKPDPRMYEEICRALSVEPSTVIYVGDGGSQELTGARAAGMRAVMLRNTRHADTADDLRYDADTTWDGERVDSMTGLAALLRDDGSSQRNETRPTENGRKGTSAGSD